jgi:hypothetical protein
MYLLTATTSSFEVILGGAITTNQLPVTSSMADISTVDQSVSALVATEVLTNSGTAVTIGSAPASGHTRTLKTFSGQNADTATATVTIRRNDSGTFTTIAKVALLTGESVYYDDNSGWKCLDASGNLKTSLTGAGSGTVTHTAGSLVLNQLVYGNSSADIKTVAAMDGQIPIGKTSDGTAALATLTAGAGISVTNAANAVTVALNTAAKTKQITFAIDGGGSVLTTGTKAQVNVGYSGTITGVALTADQSGSVQLDIKTCAQSSFPGSLASIVASDPPVLSSAQISNDVALTGWTTAFTGTAAAPIVFQFSITSVSTITRLNCALTVVVS